MMRARFTRGFTLIEMLVYVAIFVTVTTASVYLLFTLRDVVDRYRVHTALYRSSTNVMEQIVTSIRQADQFNDAGSVIHTSATGTLAVMNGATSTVFTRSGDDLNLSISGVPYGDMLGSNVRTTGFTVYEYATAVGTLVRVKLDLEATVGSSTKTMSVYGGGVIRGDL